MVRLEPPCVEVRLRVDRNIPAQGKINDRTRAESPRESPSEDRIRLTLVPLVSIFFGDPTPAVPHRSETLAMTSLSTSWTLLAAVRWGLVAVVIAVTSFYGYRYARLPEATPPAKKPARPGLQWPEVKLPADDDWLVFDRAGQAARPAAAGPPSDRYRLAGTFFAFGSSPEQQPDGMRSAILDDFKSDTQHLLKEGERAGDLRVMRIFPDHVVLEQGGSEFELWLSFSDKRPAAPRPAEREEKPRLVRHEDQPALETSRFGKRVGETRWVFQRDRLMDYYNELLEDPERLASLYLSMKPDYREGDIEGYYVDMEGEEEFFETVGLRSGDVVRRVNSMNMINQSRAEYFIKEFVKGRLSAVVLDIEREGNEEKLVYLIR